MKTIEERAKGIAERSSAETQAEKEYYYAGYVLGATEQKAIDDAHLESIVKRWKEEEEMWIKQEQTIKREMIEKACEWLKEYGDICASDYGMKSYLYDFRKAMEE